MCLEKALCIKYVAIFILYKIASTIISLNCTVKSLMKKKLEKDNCFLFSGWGPLEEVGGKDGRKCELFIKSLIYTNIRKSRTLQSFARQGPFLWLY